MPSREHLADPLGGQLLARAQPVDHEGQDELRVELEHPRDQRMVGEPADGLDDGRDQALPAVAGADSSAVWSAAATTALISSVSSERQRVGASPYSR